MRLYIDLDTRGFIESESFPRPVTVLALKRGDNVPVDLYFVRGNVIQELADAATGRIGLKPKGQFGSAFYLALDSEWQKSGEAETTKYSFSLNLSTTEIVLGKFAGKVLQAFGYVILAVPIIMLSIWFGGVSANAVVQTGVVTMVGVVLFGSIGTVVSATSRRSRTPPPSWNAACARPASSRSLRRTHSAPSSGRGNSRGPT